MTYYQHAKAHLRDLGCTAGQTRAIIATAMASGTCPITRKHWPADTRILPSSVLQRFLDQVGAIADRWRSTFLKAS